MRRRIRSQRARVAATRRGSSLAFTFLAAPAVRDEITVLRRLLGEPTPRPRYGFSRPVVALEPDAVRLYLTENPLSLFLSIPRDRIVGITRDPLRSGGMTLETVTLQVRIDGEDVPLSLPPASPTDARHRAPLGYVDDTAARLYTGLFVTA